MYSTIEIDGPFIEDGRIFINVHDHGWESKWYWDGSAFSEGNKAAIQPSDPAQFLARHRNQVMQWKHPRVTL